MQSAPPSMPLVPLVCLSLSARLVAALNRPSGGETYEPAGGFIITAFARDIYYSKPEILAARGGNVAWRDERFDET